MNPKPLSEVFIAFALALAFLYAVLTAVEFREISADHKAQLNRVIELLEKKS